MLATICDHIWNELNMQHIAQNLKKMGYSDTRSSGTLND